MLSILHIHVRLHQKKLSEKKSLRHWRGDVSNRQRDRLCTFLFNIIPLIKDPGSRTNCAALKWRGGIFYSQQLIQESENTFYLAPVPMWQSQVQSFFHFLIRAFYLQTLERIESPFGPNSVCLYNTCQRHSSACGSLFWSSADKAWHDCSDI